MACRRVMSRYAQAPTTTIPPQHAQEGGQTNCIMRVRFLDVCYWHFGGGEGGLFLYVVCVCMHFTFTSVCVSGRLTRMALFFFHRLL